MLQYVFFFALLREFEYLKVQLLIHMLKNVILGEHHVVYYIQYFIVVFVEYYSHR